MSTRNCWVGGGHESFKYNTRRLILCYGQDLTSSRADFLLFSPADHDLVVSEQGTRWCWLWLFTGLENELKCPTAPKTHLVSCHLTSILLALLALSPYPFPACTHFFFISGLLFIQAKTLDLLTSRSTFSHLIIREFLFWIPWFKKEQLNLNHCWLFFKPHNLRWDGASWWLEFLTWL